MNVPQVWKNVAITNAETPPTQFDLVNGTNFNIVQTTSGISVSQGSAFLGTVNNVQVVISGVHTVSHRHFEIVCKWDSVSKTWSHTGELLSSGGGGDGTWMADEGP
jgi:hypothetical protein